MPIYVRGEYAVLHVHIPKTGGDYLRHVFLESGFECLPSTYTLTRDVGHDDAPCPRQHFHRELIESRFDRSWTLSFAVVRHPVARFLSEYRYRVRNQSGRLAWLRRHEPLSLWARRKLRELRRDAYAGENHLRPQADFLLDDLTFVWKMEWGLAGLVDRLRELGIDLRGDLPSRNVTGGAAGKPSALPRRVERMIRDAYRVDFERLGYEGSRPSQESVGSMGPTR